MATSSVHKGYKPRWGDRDWIYILLESTQKKKYKIHEKMVLSVLHIKQQRTVIWEMGNKQGKQGEPFICHCSPLGCLTRCNMGARARESRSFLTLRGQRWGISEIRQARECRRQDENIKWICRDLQRLPHLCRSMLISIRKLAKAGAEPPKGIKENSMECSYGAGYAACSY